ncbi:MAG: hypothetical protein K0S12_1591, partial [Bacteroidetes bacterium]|nr:hypothetical protein [Bacteroidota bacterium]
IITPAMATAMDMATAMAMVRAINATNNLLFYSLLSNFTTQFS